MNKRNARLNLVSFSLMTCLVAGLLAANGAWATLIGVAPGLPLLNYNNTGMTSYNAANDVLSVDAAPIAVLFPPPRFVSDPTGGGTRDVKINIEVDNTGALIGGVPGDDLVVIGAVDTTGDNVLDADGVLLTGEIVAFGSQDSGGPTDSYDFVFQVTGGALASFYAGQNIGVTLTSEGSNFTGNFNVNFGGGAKGNIGPVQNPDIEICKLVSIDGGATFFDADGIAGDSCDQFDQNIPIGPVGATTALYQLIVKNTGTETLVGAVINDPTLGLVNVAVPGGPLNPGDVRVIESGDAGFGNLNFPSRCNEPGLKNNIAMVDASGQTTGTPVSDDDPANVDCVAEPDIDLRKEVSLTGAEPFFDANMPPGPIGAFGADATYRLVVENTGNETLVNARITDATLGLLNVAVPGGPLAPGDIRVITSGSLGFSKLFFPDRCDSIGEKLNTARVDAEGQTTMIPVDDQDPAYLTCEKPQIELLKQVSLTGGAPFFDADNPGDADVPVGALGADATYRLIVRNIGTEVLVNARITDATLGLVNVPVPGGPLNPGDERVIETGDIGFAALFFVDRCDSTGNKANIASVAAEGANTGTPVSDDNPANVNCVGEPAIELLKQVSLTGGAPFFDADNPGDADVPVGALGADATYRLIVRNIGTETLVNAVINDATLGLVNVPVPGGPLNPGDVRVIDSGDIGFGALVVIDRCDTIGNKLNTAQVKASGEFSGTMVQDDDPANVNCVGDCDIDVTKTCVIDEPPVNTLTDKCSGKIQEFTVIWGGGQPVNISGLANDDADGIVGPGQEVTFFPDGGSNDVFVTLTGGGVNGQSKFHLSCSDNDMNADDDNDAQNQVSPLGQDCGKLQGNAKSSSGFVNAWILEGLVDADGLELDCTANDPGFPSETTMCAYTPEPEGNDCDAIKDITSVTMVWNGPDGVNLESEIGQVINGINNGDVLVINGSKDTTGNDIDVTLTGTVNEDAKFHISCSDDDMDGPEDCGSSQGNGKDNNGGLNNQFLFGGMTGEKGSFTCPGVPGGSDSADVVYGIRVENLNNEAVTVDIVDAKLGINQTETIAANDTFELVTDPVSVMPGADNMFTNVVTVTGAAASGATCEATDMVVVKREPPPPPPVTCSDIKDITAVSVVWNGSDTVNILMESGEMFENVAPGNRITFQEAGTGNDVEMTISGAAQNGMSKFHVSCSDAQMNGSEDCGLPQGDGKDNESNLLNLWLFDGMTGEQGSFDCNLPNTGVVDPTNGGGPGGGDVSGAMPELTKDEFRWDITNNTGGDLVISQVQLTWPNQQGDLKEMKLDGDKFAENLGATPPSGTFTVGDFVSDTDKRTLDAGDTEEFKLKFEDDFEGDIPTDYQVTITFDGGTTVSF